MGDLISRQDAIKALTHLCSEDKNGITVSRVNVDCMLRALPSVQPEQTAYEQGRITGRVEMRTEILSALKNMVGSEVWLNV